MLQVHLLATTGKKASHCPKKAEKSPCPSAGTDGRRAVMGESSSKRVVGQQFVGLCWHHCVPQYPSSPASLRTSRQSSGVDGRCFSPPLDTGEVQEGAGTLGQRRRADAGVWHAVGQCWESQGRAGNRRRLRQAAVPVGHGRFAACGTANALPKTARSHLL